MKKMIIVYDGDCRFCKRWVRWVRRHDRNEQFEFVVCGSTEQKRLTPLLLKEKCMKEMIVVRGEESYNGGDGVAIILKNIPKTRWLGSFLALPGVNRFTRIAYRIVANNRYRMGCDSHNCKI